MRKAARHAGPPIDGNPDVGQVLDVVEEVLKVAVGHFEGESAQEERFCGWVGGASVVELAAGVVHDYLAAFEDGGVHAFDCGCRLLDSVELNVTESGSG